MRVLWVTILIAAGLACDASAATDTTIRARADDKSDDRVGVQGHGGREIAGVRVRWTGGVAATIPSWARERRVATYTLTLNGSTKVRGNLYLEGSTAPRRSTELVSRSPDGPRVTFRAGPSPSLHLRGLPPGVTSVVFATRGAGHRLLRPVAPCRDDQTFRTTVDFRGQARTVRDRPGTTDAFECGSNTPPPGGGELPASPA
jgi:hypothetical protein